MGLAHDLYSVVDSSSGSASAESGDTITSLLESASFQNYSALSAFVLLVWEYFDTLADEAMYIWGQDLTPVKLAFLFARFYGLAFQLANYVLLMTRLSQLPISHQTCKAWYGFQVVSFWLLYTASDLVLMMRVYALYRHSRRIGICLLLLHTMEGIVVSIVGWHTLEHLQFNAACDAVSIPPDVIVFATVVVTSQCVIWMLTFFKRNVGRGERVPVVDVVIRDGRLAWFVVCTVTAVTVGSSFSHQIARPHLLFSWPTTLLSIATCRLVLNIQKVPGIQRLSPASRRLRPSSMTSSRASFSSITTSLRTHTISHCSSGPITPSQQSRPVTTLTTRKSEDLTPNIFLSSPSETSLQDARSSISRTKHLSVPSHFEHRDSRVSIPQGSATGASWHTTCDIEIGSECTNTSMDSEEMREYWNELL